MSGIRLVVVAALLFLLAGCTGVPLKMPGTAIQPGETALGPVEGDSTGVMLFQFIPIDQNDRFERAYSSALGQQPGATRIADVEIQENWFWAWVLNGYTFHVRGTAVRK